MTLKNKFGITPVDVDPIRHRDRKPGPMGQAVRETAESLHESTEAKMEQRRRNAEDAKAWRTATGAGLVLVTIPLDEIRTDALPRDRLELESVAQDDEMEELKTSIRARGQREPIEVWPDSQGYQLKKGWRRLTALRQLRDETRNDAFATVIARVAEQREDQICRYVDMVEENVVREDLTFADMAQVAIAAANDPTINESDPAVVAGLLYASLHKTKRSYIRSFIYVMSILGDELRWPKALPRDLGVQLARFMRLGSEVDQLRETLANCSDHETQNKVLATFVADAKRGGPEQQNAPAPMPKLEFHVGRTKVTARAGECRIVSEEDFAEVPRERLEEAIRSFERVLRGPIKALQS